MVAMNTYYSLLEISATATQEEIRQAYQRQRERYLPERIAMLGEEFQRIAETRLAELEHAYMVLVDPQRRRAYDVNLGLVPAYT